MQQFFNRPKRFGEILDLTFQLSKSHFIDFMKIFLIIIGPIFLVESLVHLSSGVSFFREVGEGATWIEQFVNNLDNTEAVVTTIEGELWLVLLGFISLFIYPVAFAAVIIAVNHIRKGEAFTVVQVIKQGFSRFWAMLFSNILLFFIMLGLLIAIVMIITFTVFGSDSTMGVGPAVLLFIVLWIGTILGLGLFMTRISFYFGTVVIDKVTPGFVRSWRLTRKRTWALFGLYIVLSFIISAITFAFEMSVGMFLGNSVLFFMLNSLVLLFTTMVSSVAYAVVFFDLKVRNDADDLKEMIDDYRKE